MKLDIRLSAVADMILQTDTLADIGSDHAYLPVFLLREGRIKNAIITDINRAPLSSGVNNAERAGVSAHCVFRLGAGLAPLKVGEAETISICGMGGETIAGILADGEDIVSQTSLLVLQPQGNAALVRETLRSLGVGILEERIVRDRHLFYNIIAAGTGGELYNGDMELPEPSVFGYSRTYGEYLLYSLKIARGIIAQLGGGISERGEAIRERETRKIKRIEELLHEYQG